MSLYFKDIEITNIDNLVPQTGLDITELWFGSTNIYTVWATHEGTLPTTINANGADMRQYRIYGNTGGVGDRTVNLFDKNATDTDNGYVSGAYIKSDGELQNSSAWFVSEYIPVNAEEQYTIVYGSIASSRAVCYYDISKNYISGANYSGLSAQETITTPPTCAYMRLSLVLATKDTITVTTGTTLPETFVPYGYKLYMSVKSGNLFDKNAAYENGYYTSNGTYAYSDGVITYDYFPVKALTEYFYKAFNAIPSSAESERTIRVNFFDSQKTFISRFVDIGTALSIKNVTTSQNCAFVRLSVNKILSNIVFGTTPPDEYQPYSNTTTPIYIGDEPLEKDEYVDYQTQKVYRMINGTLTPTDPPVQLPALPTCEGATVIDYAGSGTAPEKVMLKYRKEGF